MRIIPDTLIEQLDFCEAHVPLWAADPLAVGLTSLQVATLAAATKIVRDNFDAAQMARNASRSATTTLHSNAKIMRNETADLLRQIKAFAQLQDVPATVYSAARISMPADSSPAPAPGVAHTIETHLNSSGSISLSWSALDASASTGAFFMVSRKLPGEIDFSGIGGTSGTTARSRRMKFTDNTLPASAAAQGAQYVIQGFRGTRAGEVSVAIVVQFGSQGGSCIVARGAHNMLKQAA